MKNILHLIGETALTLLPQKAIYIGNSKTLVISDLHLGKAAHFRKHGIPISKNIHNNDLEILDSILNKIPVKLLLVVGDLFHSDLNGEWGLFKAFLSAHKNLKVELVAGNHDRLTQIEMGKSITIHPISLQIDSLLFTHEPLELSDIPIGLYNICGHLHPAVILRGKGRQTIKLPCFYFGEKQGILPAFGKFTGSAIITPKRRDNVFIIANQSVVKMG